jgi:hypothetical protein
MHARIGVRRQVHRVLHVHAGLGEGGRERAPERMKVDGQRALLLEEKCSGAWCSDCSRIARVLSGRFAKYAGLLPASTSFGPVCPWRRPDARGSRQGPHGRVRIRSAQLRRR